MKVLWDNNMLPLIQVSLQNLSDKLFTSGALAFSVLLAEGDNISNTAISASCG
jgi:hypothetical protein